MPIYEYRCLQCDTRVEVLQRIHDKPLRRCEKCAGKLEKLVSRTSFALKGGGWFDSGYTKSSPSDSGPKSEGGGAESSAKPETKSETKSDKPDKAESKKTTPTGGKRAASA